MKKNIIIVAHPDDEVLFFTGPLYKEGALSHVVLVTDGNGDGNSETRLKEFKKIMETFNVGSYETYQLPDKYNTPLNIETLQQKLKLTAESQNFLKASPKIWTHGPFGDYGHPHHIQISYRVHKLFLESYEIFHPNILELQIEGPIYEEEEIYIKKLNCLTTIYRNEFSRFVTLLAPKRIERHIPSVKEHFEVIEFLMDAKKSLPKNLGGYEYFHESLKLFKEAGLQRKF